MAASKPVGGKKGAGRKKKGGLGAPGRALELDRPMGEGLASQVEPPPPLPSLPAARAAPQPAPKPVVPAPKPVVPAPKPAVPASKPAPPPQAKKAVDLDLLPWVVKKQLAIETDREDLDFEIIFWIEGKSDRLVLEGHRNDFGRLYLVDSQTPGGCWKRHRDSEFKATSGEDLFATYRGHIITILVRTQGLEIEFSDLADFLEWARY